MATINLTLLRFLISHRVPGGCPYLFTFTFTSHLGYIVRRGRTCERCTHGLHAAVARPDGPEHGLESANILARRLLWGPRQAEHSLYEIQVLT